MSEETQHPTNGGGGAELPHDAWGRVAEDGSVFVRTADGERLVGSWQAGKPDEALAYFERKYQGLSVEIDLLAKRLHTTDLAPKEAHGIVEHLRAQVAEAHVVGDLAALESRLDELAAAIDRRREERRAARAQAHEEARASKQELVAEAERLAESTDWRAAGERLRALVETWKGLPRLERKSDDELWHRFSHARSVFSKRRKGHFASLDQQRDEAQRRKEKLVTAAEELSRSTDWGPTAARYRELMTDWKAAGRAHREAEEDLWTRFRGAQDVFFQARSAVFAERDSEQRDNQALKEELVVEAERIVPVEDLRSARAALRSVNERWERIGHVPREARPKLEGRLHAVERAVAEAEDAEWRRTNPEARARALDTVEQLRASLEKLRAQAEKASASGNQRKAEEARSAIAAREEWLTQAERALEEFSG